MPTVPTPCPTPSPHAPGLSPSAQALWGLNFDSARWGLLASDCEAGVPGSRGGHSPLGVCSLLCSLKMTQKALAEFCACTGNARQAGVVRGHRLFPGRGCCLERTEGRWLLASPVQGKRIRWGGFGLKHTVSANASLWAAAGVGKSLWLCHPVTEWGRHLL